MTGLAPIINRLEFYAYDIKYEFLPTKRPQALSEDPYSPWSSQYLYLTRSDRLTYLEQPLLGHLVEQDALPGSDSVFGPT